MVRTSRASYPDDIGKWVALGSALVALGILPKGWQKTLAAASAAIVIIKMFE
jgi:hypothetical protein